MKKYSFVVTLFVIEVAFFYLCCSLLAIDLYITVRYGIALFVFLLIFNHYNISSILIWDEMKSLFKSALGFVIISLIIVEKNHISIQLVIRNGILTIMMVFICLILDRYLRILFRSFMSKRTLIIGTGFEANRLGEIARHNRFALTNVIGYVKLGEKIVDSSLVDKIKMSNNRDLNRPYSIYELNEIEDVIARENVQQVIIALPSSSKKEINKIMITIHDKVDEIKYLPNLDIIMTFDSKVQDFDGILLISTARGKISFLNKMLKRLIDILGGIIGILLLAPLTVYVKKKNKKANDNDPIFFIQERIGEDGKPIKIYKFRTMVPNAEKILEKLMKEDPAIKEEYLTNKKLVNDPRITKVGEFLRKSSLDEFPQFVNVLKGEMSIVGPRPYLYREKKDMGIYYNTIIKCKPGITGMWQANGRSDVGFEERCKLDDYYYKNWTVWLDFIIVYKTIKSVIYGKGAI